MGWATSVCLHGLTPLQTGNSEVVVVTSWMVDGVADWRSAGAARA